MIGYGNSMFLATHGILARSTAAPAFSFLLDDYSGAAAAYSLRKLRSAYSGNAIRVRRSSDNTEQDFGFVNNVLDTASLLTFCGAGNGFVTTWYDQSGNALNTTNTTAANQPQIVSSGSVLMQNSKPTMLFDGSNDSLFRANTNIFRNKNYGVIFTANRFIATPVTNSRAILYVSNSLGGTRYSNGKTTSSNYNLAARRLDGDSAQVIATTTTYNNTNLFLTTGIVDWGNTDAYLYVNNNLQVSNTNFLTAGNTDNTQSYLSISSAEGTAFANAHISEVVIYESSQDVNGINTNLNSFYSIY
jgi:hypothetical protein